MKWHIRNAFWTKAVLLGYQRIICIERSSCPTPCSNTQLGIKALKKRFPLRKSDFCLSFRERVSKLRSDHLNLSLQLTLHILCIIGRLLQGNIECRLLSDWLILNEDVNFAFGFAPLLSAYLTIATV